MEFAGALSGREEGRGDGGCTPLYEETVRAWLDQLGTKARSKSGTRVFHDHLPDAAQEGASRLLGQHVRLVCERAR